MNNYFRDDHIGFYLPLSICPKSLILFKKDSAKKKNLIIAICPKIFKFNVGYSCPSLLNSAISVLSKNILDNHTCNFAHKLNPLNYFYIFYTLRNNWLKIISWFKGLQVKFVQNSVLSINKECNCVFAEFN